MAQLPRVDRIISGKGTITIPESYARANRVILYTQVIRENASVYRNFSTNPTESFFANVTFGREGFIYKKLQVEYDQQAFELFDGTGYALMSALICLEKSMRDKFLVDSSDDPVQVALLGDLYIDEFTAPGFLFDEMRFVCFGGTALKLTLTGTEQEKCNGDTESPPPPPPPPPPAPLPKVPVDEPVDYSDPEDNIPEDTDPFPLDVPPEPPPPPPLPGVPTNPCIEYKVFYNLIRPGNTTITNDILVLGVIEGTYNRPNPTGPGSFEVGFIAGRSQAFICFQSQFIPLTIGNEDWRIEITDIQSV